nr:GNAT family N-acetyltransferase [Bacteroidota bacterium]
DKTGYQRTQFTVEGEVYDAVLFQSNTSSLFPEIAGSSIFLSRAYHRALADAPPEKMDFWYVRIEEQGVLIGMLCFQVEDFNPGKSLQKHARGNLFKIARYKVASLINFRVLCLGNTLVTGDYGFCFEEKIAERLRTLLMMQSIDWLLTLKPFRRIGLIFVKDFYNDIFIDLPDSSYCKKYHCIDTQPSMIMDIPTMWGGLSGYLDALKSKYRVRARKALSVSAELEKVELSLDEIKSTEEILHSLYLNIAEDVGFNLFTLSKQYFSSLKRQLGDRFHLWVYKDNEEIIGFYTVFEDGDILDAHFLGYNPEDNHTFRLYLSMLLSMIDYAASNGFRQLQLSRTATEIKSSVGAEGIPMWAYLRIPNRVLNNWLPWAYSFFKPELGWVAREPFHET